MVSELALTDAPVEMGSSEILPYSVDTVPVLDEGEAPISATVTLSDLTANLDFPGGLVGGATIDGTTITQVIGGLVPGHQFRLSWTFTVAANKVWTLWLDLVCPG